MAIKKVTCVMKPAGADGSATATGTLSFGRPGILLGVKITSVGQPSTLDLDIEDEADNVLMTFTDIGNTTVGPAPVVSDGVTDDGAAAADKGIGYPFRSGLSFEVTQADAYVAATDDGPVVVDCWIEF